MNLWKVLLSLSNLIVIVFCDIDSNAKPLIMDVQWVMQGVQFSFQGFFVEFLGYSSAFIEFMPYLRLVKSNFIYSLTEPSVSNEDSFYYQEMFFKEGNNTHYLSKNIYPTKHIIEGNNIPSSAIFGMTEISRLVCDINSEYAINGSYVNNISYQNEEIGRSFVTDINSGSDCCHICLKQPLCVAWTYNADHGCHLLGNYKYKTVDTVGSLSGSFHLQWKGRIAIPKAIIFHGTSCNYNNLTIHQNGRDINTILIARLMVER